MGQRSDELRPREFVVRLPTSGDAAGADASDDDQLAAAREDIELTRADMTSTIEAIQERLDPEVLSETAKDTAHDVTDYAIREAKEAAREITENALQQAREVVRDVTGQAKLALREATLGKVEHMARSANDTAGGWRGSVMETIKANPMPATLVGLGIGWMLLNRPSSSSSPKFEASGASGYAGRIPPAGAGYGGAYGQSPVHSGGLSSAASGAQDRVGQVADQAQNTAGQVVSQVQGGASQVLGQVQETGGQVVDMVQGTGAQVVGQVQEQASHAQSFIQQQLHENPLLVGAVAVAIGGALAGTMRSTPREDQLLGEARDRLIGSAKDLTQDTIDKVSHVVDQAQSAAKETARQEELVPRSPATTSTPT